MIIPFPAFERDSDTITLSSNQNTSLHFTSLLSLSDVHFHLIRVSFHGFRFLDFHAHVVLFTPLSFAIWFVSLTFTKFNSPFFSFFFKKYIIFIIGILGAADLYVEESEGSDDFRAEFLCPFCAEDYDVVSLCCHIDDHHPIQAKNGVRSFLRKLTSIGSYIAKLFTLCTD